MTARVLRTCRAAPSGRTIGLMTPDTPIDIARLPALAGALWDQQPRVRPAREVLHLYEDRWRYIDAGAMGPEESAALADLICDVGRGVFLGR